MRKLVKIGTSFPNRAEVKGIYAEKYSPYSLSRYKRLTILLDDKYHYETLKEDEKNIVTTSDTTYTVTAADKNRLDIIAYRIYGDASLYWILVYANNISDPFDVPIGTQLLIPNIEDLYRSGGVLK